MVPRIVAERWSVEVHYQVAVNLNRAWSEAFKLSFFLLSSTSRESKLWSLRKQLKQATRAVLFQAKSLQKIIELNQGLSSEGRWAKIGQPSTAIW